MVDDALGFALLKRHVQGRQHQVGGHALTHGPAHHTAAPDIDDHSQIEETHPGRHIGHVGHPQLVRASGVEAAIDQVIGRGLTFVATGGDSEASALADAVDNFTTNAWPARRYKTGPQPNSGWGVTKPVTSSLPNSWPAISSALPQDDLCNHETMQVWLPARGA